MTATTTDLDTLAEVVARLRRALRRAVRADLTKQTLPVAQIEVLQLLAERPGLRSGEVGEALLLAPTTISTLVGALLSARLIERAPDPADRRAWHLHLTSRGTRELARWQQSNKRVLRDAMAALGAADRQALRGALPALAALVNHLDAQRCRNGGA
jgi:DNA-binding MarR family transcriptional regulator